MVRIDTERVRRHIQAALASLPLLACAPEPALDADTTLRTAPPDVGSMQPIPPESVPEAEAPRAASVRVDAPPEDPGQRARERRHAELRKHPPRPVPGRPLRVGGRDVIALLRKVDTCAAEEALGLELDLDARARIAAAWMCDARYEHASIASFERAHAELAAHGAPAALLDATRRAAADEAVHASLCLAMAWRYGAPALAPGPLEATPPRIQSLATLAADVLEEGAVNETFAAAVAATGARRCEARDARALLARIADDESAHAALAFATLRWAVSADPEARDAVAERAAALRPARALDAVTDPGALAAHGRLEGAELERAWAYAWRDVIDPLLEDLLAA